MMLQRILEESVAPFHHQTELAALVDWLHVFRNFEIPFRIWRGLIQLTVLVAEMLRNVKRRVGFDDQQLVSASDRQNLN